MIGILRALFSKRSFVGTIVLLLLVGEPTVGFVSGLFSLPGIVVFFFLYFVLFHFFESIIYKYQLVMYQVILLTFALYSVFVTGFLNKELTEYALNPNPFVTLIRIQASFFVAFAFYLLNNIIPKNTSHILSLKQSIVLLLIFTFLMSLTGQWGIPSLFFTLKTVPLLSLFFILLAGVFLYLAFRTHPQSTEYKSKLLTFGIYLCLLLGAIPSLISFTMLVFVMVILGIYVIFNKTAKNHKL